MFLEYLDAEAKKVPYDNQTPKKGQLPPYYDETKFKKYWRYIKESQKNIFIL